MKKIFVLIMLFTLMANNKPKEHSCSNQVFFNNLVQQDKNLAAATIHTFSKTGKGNFWFWHEKRALLNAAIPGEEMACETPSLLIVRELTLKDGIVADEKAVGSSTYLVTADWAKDAIYQAMMHGETIRITKL